MPKIQIIDPAKVRSKNSITFNDIPVNVYNRTLVEERVNFCDESLVRIFRDMAIIREFETMLNLIKTTNEYNGISYNHPGPAHLSIGQEASAVGQAYSLDRNDFIFGSHRSHGEILAKGLSAIEKLSDSDLMETMKSFFDGAILKVVENRGQQTVKELAVDFLLYGTLAEIFARETGFNKGLGGSMHAFFTPFGIYPNNAIVGGSADIAMGSALFKKINRKAGIVIANIGDASMGCGPVWEAMNMAAMDQFKYLWEGDYQGGLPIIFNFFNNSYGMGGQTAGETMAYQVLARIGAGINPEQMHAERIDGFNPLAVIDAVKRKKQLLLDRKGPVLLDTLTYRFSGHSPSDASSYRTKEEVQLWMDVDPLITYKQQLVDAKVADMGDMNTMLDNTKELITKILKLAIDDNLSPRMNMVKYPDQIGDLMFSNERVEKMEDRPCEVLMPKEDNPRVQQLKNKIRTATVDGKPVSKNKMY
ncbi:MAG: thiamine pyrophosphate-dependent dehydrogenase E1 component subunit alpha, partial [Firmicutes bacterium]|nr:thiamine pyrophosphate-dependent dehydrogenase E1 component subunit alpha [Bacillota bacterium]